jgi:hypothetical protein
MAEQASSVENEQTQTPAGTTSCAIHGLRFDARLSTGCVLCRRAAEADAEAAASNSRTVVKAVVVALVISAALGAWLVVRKQQAGARYATPAAMVSGTKSAHAACYSDCAQAHALCENHCRAKPGDATCGEYCLSGANACFTDCSGRQIKADPPWSYYYGTDNMPAWSAILESALGVHDRLLACSAAPPVSTLAYVQVRGQDGTLASVTLLKDDLSEQVHECAVGVFQGTHFTPSSQGDYAFLARFDARYDGARLLIAQTETEVAALPRLVSDDTGETLKSRLFDAKLYLEKQEQGPQPSLIADVRSARLKLARLKSELSDLQYGKGRAYPQLDRLSKQYLDAEKQRLEEQRRKLTEDQISKRERETREETERYRRLNREYRDREERAKYQRMWEEHYGVE